MTTNPVWYQPADTRRLIEQVASAFEDAYSQPPAGVWAAPGRVNLIGEHVDYNQGLCLPFALAQRTFVALRPRADGVVRVRSAQEPVAWEGRLDDVRPPLEPSWAGYVVGVPWSLRAAGHDVPGMDMTVDSQLPRGAGLSSSAALECAVAVALDEVADVGLGHNDAGRRELAALCAEAENRIAGAPTGGLDQSASLRAAAGHALLLDCVDFSVRQVPLDLASAGLAVLVIDTRVHHALLDGRYGSRREACRRACEALGVPSLRDVGPSDLEDAWARLSDPETRRRVRHVVSEVQRVREAVRHLDQGEVDRLGPLLDASHRSLRDDYEVSCAELDLACEAALGAGALGARMTGGGFGGSAVALVAQPGVEQVARAVSSAFERAGLGAPAFAVATPSGPAGRTDEP